MLGWTNVVVSFVLPFNQNLGGSPDRYSQPMLDGFSFFLGQLASADVPWTSNCACGLNCAYEVSLGIQLAFTREYIGDCGSFSGVLHTHCVADSLYHCSVAGKTCFCETKTVSAPKTSQLGAEVR